jgi:hypothetical protein
LFAALGGLAIATPAARAAGPPRRPTTVSDVWARTELYFGTSRAIDPPVTERQFHEFVEREVTERFPDGLTLLEAYGQFRTSAGVLVREKSFLLILFYPPQMQDAHRRIQEIRQAYKDAYSQESVLRVDAFSFVSF